MDNYGFTRLDAERAAPVLYAHSVDSTNNALKKLSAQGAPDGTVLCSRKADTAHSANAS